MLPMGFNGCNNLDSVRSIDLTNLQKWGALRGSGQSGTIRWERDGEERGAVGYKTVTGPTHHPPCVFCIYPPPVRASPIKWNTWCLSSRLTADMVDRSGFSAAQIGAATAAAASSTSTVSTTFAESAQGYSLTPRHTPRATVALYSAFLTPENWKRH